MRVLLVEDDNGVADAVAAALALHGHVTERVSRGGDALSRYRDADLVLLDLWLPDIHGLEVLRELRRMGSTPVIVLTGDGHEQTELRGLGLGADYYVVKPVRLDVLLARIDAVMRRVPPSEGRVSVADLTVDLDARRLHVGEREIELTAKEFDILAVLARNLGAAVSRETLLVEVWGYADPAASRSLDVHITKLRAKLGRPGLIITKRGYGFLLEDAA